MRPSPEQVLLSPFFALALLWRHWVWTAGITAMATALSMLAPVLQQLAGIPESLEANLLVQFAILMLPLELYVIPRFLLGLDAEVLSLPSNPREGTARTFEARWLRYVGAKVALNLAAGAGLLLFIFPGIFILMAFGWTPTRVLLRGEDLRTAARNSVALMARAWLPVLLVVGLMGLVTLFLKLLVLGALVNLDPVKDAWMRLRHASYWGGYACASLLDVWLATALLTLFQTVEPLAYESSEK